MTLKGNLQLRDELSYHVALHVVSEFLHHKLQTPGMDYVHAIIGWEFLEYYFADSGWGLSPKLVGFVFKGFQAAMLKTFKRYDRHRRIEHAKIEDFLWVMSMEYDKFGKPHFHIGVHSPHPRDFKMTFFARARNEESTPARDPNHFWTVFQDNFIQELRASAGIEGLIPKPVKGMTLRVFTSRKWSLVEYICKVYLQTGTSNILYISDIWGLPQHQYIEDIMPEEHDDLVPLDGFEDGLWSFVYDQEPFKTFFQSWLNMLPRQIIPRPGYTGAVNYALGLKHFMVAEPVGNDKTGQDWQGDKDKLFAHLPSVRERLFYTTLVELLDEVADKDKTERLIMDYPEPINQEPIKWEYYTDQNLVTEEQANTDNALLQVALPIEETEPGIVLVTDFDMPELANISSSFPGVFVRVDGPWGDTPFPVYATPTTPYEPWLEEVNWEGKFEGVPMPEELIMSLYIEDYEKEGQVYADAIYSVRMDMANKMKENSALNELKETLYLDLKNSYFNLDMKRSKILTVLTNNPADANYNANEIKFMLKDWMTHVSAYGITDFGVAASLFVQQHNWLPDEKTFKQMKDWLERTRRFVPAVENLDALGRFLHDVKALEYPEMWAKIETIDGHAVRAFRKAFKVFISSEMAMHLIQWIVEIFLIEFDRIRDIKPCPRALVLLGPSNAGKSLLLRTLFTVIVPKLFKDVPRYAKLFKNVEFNLTQFQARDINDPDTSFWSLGDFNNFDIKGLKTLQNIIDGSANTDIKYEALSSADIKRRPIVMAVGIETLDQFQEHIGGIYRREAQGLMQQLFKRMTFVEFPKPKPVRLVQDGEIHYMSEWLNWAELFDSSFAVYAQDFPLGDSVINFDFAVWKAYVFWSHVADRITDTLKARAQKLAEVRLAKLGLLEHYHMSDEVKRIMKEDKAKVNLLEGIESLADMKERIRRLHEGIDLPELGPRTQPRQIEEQKPEKEKKIKEFTITEERDIPYNLMDEEFF